MVLLRWCNPGAKQRPNYLRRLQVFRGRSASNFNPRFWNGTFHYGFQGCSQLRVPVSFTLSADTASAGFTYVFTGQGQVQFDASSSVNADLYDWDFGDGNTGTGVNPTHSYVASGTYFVTLTVTDTTGGCTGTTVAVDSLVVIPWSVEENLLNNSLEIYPNPTDGVVNISFDPQESAKAELSLRDISGKLIMIKEYQNLNGRFSEPFDFSTLPKGVYMLKVESGGLSAIRRLNIK